MLICILHEFKKLYYKKTTWFLIFTSAVIAVLSLIYHMVDYPWISHTGYIKSMCEVSLIRDSTIGLFLLPFIIPLFSSIMHSDTFFNEKTHKTTAVYIVKKGRRVYFWSKAIVVFFSSLFISMLPFIINQLLCQIAYPLHEIRVDPGYYLPFNLEYEQSRLSYPGLYYNRPLVYNYLHILLVGIYGATLGLVSFIFSLFYKKHNKLVMLSFSTIYSFIIALFAITINMNDYVIMYYLLGQPTIKGVNIMNFYYMIAFLLLPGILLLFYRIRVERDIL